MPGTALPFVDLPGKGVRVQYAAGTIDALGLVAGRRVGHRQLAVDQEPVGGAGPAIDARAVPAAGLVMQRVHAAISQLDRHGVGIRRPQREAGGAIRLYGGAVQAGYFEHARDFLPVKAKES